MSLFRFANCLLITCTFISCAPNSANNAVKAAAEMWQAEKSTVSFLTKTDTQQGESQTLIATLVNPKLGEGFQDDQITSTCALTIMKTMRAVDLEDIDIITVSVDKGDHKFEASYSLFQLGVADSLATQAVQFLKYFDKKDTINILHAVDHTFISDSVILGAIPAFMNIDSIYGPTTKLSITGFQFNTIKSSGLDVVVVWVDGLNGTATSKYTVIYSEETRKIIHLGINED